MEVLNIYLMKHSYAYVSLSMRHIHRQDQPERKRLRTPETCSTAMRIDQINAVRQAQCAINPVPSRDIQGQGAQMAYRVCIKCEGLLTNNASTITTNSDCFKFEIPFSVLDKSLLTAGAGLN